MVELISTDSFGAMSSIEEYDTLEQAEAVLIEKLKSDLIDNCSINCGDRYFKYLRMSNSGVMRITFFDGDTYWRVAEKLIDGEWHGPDSVAFFAEN